MTSSLLPSSSVRVRSKRYGSSSACTKSWCAAIPCGELKRRCSDWNYRPSPHCPRISDHLSQTVSPWFLKSLSRRSRTKTRVLEKPKIERANCPYAHILIVTCEQFTCSTDASRAARAINQHFASNCGTHSVRPDDLLAVRVLETPGVAPRSSSPSPLVSVL